MRMKLETFMRPFSSLFRKPFCTSSYTLQKSLTDTLQKSSLKEPLEQSGTTDHGDHRKLLPKRIPAGGKDSNELNKNGNGNGNGLDGGHLLNETDHIQGEHGWKEKHASDSEAIVKAERHEKDGNKETTESLQKRTVEHFTRSIKE